MSSGNLASDAEEGREALFEQVVRDCTRLISRIAASYENDAALRGELTQDILLAIWMALPAYRGESGLRPFVAGIAHKRASSHVGRRVREPRKVELPIDLVSTAILPDELAIEKDFRRSLLDAVAQLPPPQREAILLCFDGFAYAQIGEALGISANAATLRCQRAKASLREVMARRS